MKKLLTSFKILLAILLFSYIAITVVAFIFQRSLLYFPSHRDKQGQGYRPFRPLLDDHAQFVGYFRQETDSVKRAVVLFHGNAGEAIDRAWVAQLVPNPDVALILAEYPGYGARQGKPTELTLVNAGKEMIHLVRKRWNVPISVIGESLGTGVAAAVTGEEGIERIALISPFHSIQEVAQSQFRWLPMNLLLRDKFLSSEFLRLVKIPLYVIHGTMDDIVSFDSGRRLYEDYSGPSKSFQALDGVAHNDIVPHLIESKAAEGFRNFVRVN